MRLDRNGLYELPAGKLAAVVTYLEMRAPPHRPDRAPPPSGVRLRHVVRPDPDAYRDLYRRIGAPWLWFSRLAMKDDELLAVLRDPRVEVHVLEVGGGSEGLVELDRRVEGEVELAFFGLTPLCVGRGLGRWMMHQAIELAFARPVDRFWVHTCTLDHPRALEFYRKAGFRAYARAIEIADDPRLTGLLSADAAPDVPVV